VTEHLRVPVSPLTPGDVVLERDVGRYVTRVHRRGPGDAFVAFDPDARTEADVRIVSVTRVVRCRIEHVRPSTTIARTGITLVQAVGKGDKPERILRDATALGVERVVFCVSQRTIARPGDRAHSRHGRWRAVAVDASRQCGRGDVPVVEGPLSFDDAIAAESSRPALRLCLAPNATLSLVEATSGWRRGEPLSVMIGPEGGFDDAELAAAEARGFARVSFGRFVLRTETASVAVLGALLARE
jgi:16S rRNA (uracil1498-N3)-methyltransferase